MARCVVAWDGEIWRTAWLSLDNIHIYDSIYIYMIIYIYILYDYIYIYISIQL